MVATPSDPHDWLGIQAAQQQAAQNGWQWNAADPYNWTQIAAQQNNAEIIQPHSGQNPDTMPLPTTPGYTPTGPVIGSIDGPATAGAPATQTAPPAAPAGPVTPVPSTPGTDADTRAQQIKTFGEMKKFLDSIQMGQLFSVGPDGTPGGWLWDEVVVPGIKDMATFQIKLEQTEQYKTRFAVIDKILNAAAPGVHVPDAPQVLEYEQKVRQSMINAGAPEWFYDSYTDMQDLLGKGLSADEVKSRLEGTLHNIKDIDPSIKKAFHDMYGIVDGDAALFAAMLDPGKTGEQLDRAARAAYVKGMGSNVGLEFDKAVSERIGALGKSNSAMSQDIADIAKMGGIFVESISETEDLTAGTTGADAVIFGNGQASSSLERRVLARQANRNAGTGGALLTNAGVSGVGTAEGR